MCLLIVLRSAFAEHPLLVASNRDERRDRKASPPGLWVGRRHRVISPRDRTHGGTWMGVNDRGLFAGLTNVTQAPAPADAPSRGHLVHLALDEDDLEAATAAVLATVDGRPHAGFQLVIADRQATRVVRYLGGTAVAIDWHDPVLVVSNEHGPGELQLAGLRAALRPVRTVEDQLDQLVPLLLDAGGPGRHAVLKRGGDYGTVSSSLVAVPAGDPRGLIWRFAAGPPDVAEYRDYGNLGRRLLADGEPLAPDRRPD